jgi:hypothetical protein
VKKLKVYKGNNEFVIERINEFDHYIRVSILRKTIKIIPKVIAMIMIKLRKDY